MKPATKFCNWIRRSSWEYRYSHQKRIRKKWWIFHKDYDLNKVVFTDETALKTGEKKYKKMDEKRREKHYIIEKIFKKCKLLRAICKVGKCSLKLSTQNMDAEFYVKILTKKFNKIRSIVGKKLGVTI